MNFATAEFGVFFAVVLAVYFLLDHRRQNWFLLLASYVFYGWWDWRFLGLLFFSTLLDYACALGVDRGFHPHRPEKLRRLILAASVAGNLAVLGFFKYYDFFAESLGALAGAGGIALHLPLLRIVLPVGISFYTFQTMSYTLDVFRGDLRATRNFPDLMLYVGFFPQLVAGPIERGAHLLPQILNPRTPSLDGFYGGARLAFVGLFKKMVIADNMAVLVNGVYGAAQPVGGAVALGTYAFALQIYCDFSGYSDIARGTARMLGFDLCENFRLPYLAADPADFWRRWHISLSSWLRDYLYIPLGGNRRGRARTLINLAIVMLLGGLWHGAAWHFVAWGAFHGLLLVLYRLRPAAGGEGRRGGRFWLSALFFFHLTCFGWLLFRATDLAHAGRLIAAIGARPFWDPSCGPLARTLAAAALPLAAFQIYQYRRRESEVWSSWPVWGRALFYLALFYGVVLLGAPDINEFIYFQF